MVFAIVTIICSKAIIIDFCLTCTEPPGSPTSFEYKITGYNTLVLSWITPQFTGGPDIDIDNYTIDLVPSDQAGSCVGGKCTVVGNSYNITDLSVNTWYNMTVTATNCVGNGNTSEILHFESKLSCKPVHVVTYKQYGNARLIQCRYIYITYSTTSSN